MKELSLQDKDTIRDALNGCDEFISAQELHRKLEDRGEHIGLESLSGVSAATISTILNSKYASISDDMFVRIATQIGYSLNAGC